MGDFTGWELGKTYKTRDGRDAVIDRINESRNPYPRNERGDAREGPRDGVFFMADIFDEGLVK